MVDPTLWQRLGDGTKMVVVLVGIVMLISLNEFIRGYSGEKVANTIIGLEVLFSVIIFLVWLRTSKANPADD